MTVLTTSDRAPDETALRKIAARLRGRVIEMSHAAQAAHLASALSCCDILAAAYCGAGAGLLAGPVFSFLVVLAARLLDAETGGIAALGEAAEAVGAALLWGPVAGAAGGLGIGALVALFKRSAPR